MQNYTKPSPSSQVVMRPARVRSGHITSTVAPTNPGRAEPGRVHGGGGPENRGARSSEQMAIPFYQNQPSWRWEEQLQNEYFGFAAPSTKPDMSGMPANNFRFLGDNHGGRG